MVQNKIIESNRVREFCTNISVNNDGDRILTSNVSDRVGNGATELVAISRSIDKWLKKRAIIVEQIDNIEDPEVYEVLTLRYVQQMSVEDIAEEMDRTKRQIFKRLRAAHDVFEEIYGETYKNDAKLH